MIPYDDLVVALSGWRMRQGLPVAHVTGVAASAAPRAPAPTPVTTRTATAPPRAPPRPASPAFKPAAELDDFDGDALIEDSPYDISGEDYVVPLGQDLMDQPGESTAIGDAPEPVTEGLLVPKRGKRNPDW